MVRSTVIVGIIGIALLGVTGLSGQDAKRDGKARGTLPQNWAKLGLSEDQKQKIYMVQTDYKGRIEALEKQIGDMKKKQMDEMTKVLTAAQKTQLKQIISDKVGGGDDKDDGKKPADKNP